MRADDFFIDELVPDQFGMPMRSLNVTLLEELRQRPAEDRDDVEVAVALARLLHDDLERYGTAGGQELSEVEMRVAIRALHAVVQRLGLGFDLPFRDFATFRGWWVAQGARGSGGWQARRNLLASLFEPLHDQLADLEQEALSSSLAEPVSPHARTGWAGVDAEITELRRHFRNARTAQDYRNVGLDCVAVTEALSRQVYDPGAAPTRRRGRAFCIEH